MTLEDISNIINECNSRSQVLKRLGYAASDSRRRRQLNDIIKKYNIDISHFGAVHSTTERWNDDDRICQLASQVTSMKEFLVEMGLKDIGGNATTARNHFSRLNIDTTHFKKSWQHSRNTKIPHDIMFCINSPCVRSIVRIRVLTEKLIPYVCEQNCGISDMWNGKKIVLHLDHINGISDDNRLENLRFLCPNCHSQTSTYAGRNLNQCNAPVAQ